MSAPAFGAAATGAGAALAAGERAAEAISPPAPCSIRRRGKPRPRSVSLIPISPRRKHRLPSPLRKVPEGRKGILYQFYRLACRAARRFLASVIGEFAPCKPLA